MTFSIGMIIQSIAGIVFFIFIAWIMSENRKSIAYKTVIIGLVLQFVLALILLNFEFFREIFLAINKAVLFLEESTQAGTSFVFGYIGGGTLPFDEKFPGSSFILAFRALPLILVISALSALFFHWGIVQYVVKVFAWSLKRTLKVGGTEAVAVSANIFVGMVESPLFIRPYLKNMTRSEIFTVMTTGMATIAGTVMVLYASILRDTIADIMGHILTASIISAPAAIIVSKIMIPETDTVTSGELIESEKNFSAMDALTQGTIQGVQLLMNIIAMIIVLVALVHLANIFLGLIPEVQGQPITLQRLLGYVMAPVVWLMGIPWNESLTAGSLMGSKTILNELIAYIEMSRLEPGALSSRSLIIMTYALCGFANPGSLGIMIGGMGAMAPERRNEIVSLGFRSIIAGTLATSMTGAVVGIIYR
jgi:CNT family concentrative nucleoside transporter